MQFGLSESVAHWGRYRPDSIAVYSNGLSISYGQLNTRVDALCTRLLQEGFKAPRIAAAAGSKLMSLVSYLAVLRLGKSIILLNPALKDDALRTNLADTNAVEFIHDESLSRLKGLFVNQPRTVSLESVDWSQPKKLPLYREANGCDEWGVLFSSGSTGTPKGIERDQYSMVTEFLGWCLELTLSRRTTFYIGRPVFYTGGLVLTGSVLLVGGAVVLNDHGDDNDAASTWKDLQTFVQSHSVEWAFFVPDQLRAFMKFAALEKARKGARSIVVMGAPITSVEKLKVRELLQSEVVESWGNSESLGTITDPEDLDIRPESVGRPFLTDALVVVNDDGNVLPPNTIGRIAGDEEAGFQGYSNRQDATARARRNSMIISDDIGYLDDRGYLYVRGREQESFVCGGKNFFVGELERSIAGTAGVIELAIVPFNSETGTTILRALVVQANSKTPFPASQIIAELNRALPAPLSFEKVVLSGQVPRTPSGKVDRAACRSQVSDPR